MELGIQPIFDTFEPFLSDGRVTVVVSSYQLVPGMACLYVFLAVSRHADTNRESFMVYKNKKIIIPSMSNTWLSMLINPLEKNVTSFVKVLKVY